MVEKIKHICFDLNKTLIKENTWKDLNLEMGISLQMDKFLFDLYQSGHLSYIDWQKKLEKLYIKNGKATKNNILKIISNYTYVPDVKETIQYLKSKNYSLSLISGSMDSLVQKVAQEIGINKYAANNEFKFDNNDNLQKIICHGNDSDFKLLKLQEFCIQEGIDIKNSACVGDGDNDLKIFVASGHGVTFTGSKIEKYSWKKIDKLKELQNIF